MSKIARNGAAIIGDVLVPSSEVRVLQTLVKLDHAVTVPQIARALNGEMSDASLYSLLRRLNEQRGLVTRKAVLVEFEGISLRRIQWSADKAAKTFFLQGETNASQEEAYPSARGGAGQPAQATCATQ